MKWIDTDNGQTLDNLPKDVYGLPTLELTQRNLETLLAKLHDPKSLRTLIDPETMIAIRAVDNVDHYADRDPGRIYMPSTGEIR
jgi:hypothetical protein